MARNDGDDPGDVRSRGPRTALGLLLWALAAASTGIAASAAASDAGADTADASSSEDEGDDLPQPDGKGIFGCQTAGGAEGRLALGLALTGLWVARRRPRPGC